MKTIEIISGGQKAQFTTKSVTLDGKEFFYANMSDVSNHTEQHAYTFTYDGTVKTLPYEEKDAKVLNAIFQQVQAIQAKKKAAEEAAAKEAAQAVDKSTEPIPSGAESAPVSPEESPEQTTVPAVKEASETAEEKTGEEKKPKQSVKDIFNIAKKEKAEAAKKAKDEQMDSLAESMAADPERQARLKKSFTIFGIIVAAVIVLSVIYYVAFGTSNDPTPANPNVTESQQYDDIDELIDDMQ